VRCSNDAWAKNRQRCHSEGRRDSDCPWSRALTLVRQSASPSTISAGSIAVMAISVASLILRSCVSGRRPVESLIPIALNRCGYSPHVGVANLKTPQLHPLFLQFGAGEENVLVAHFLPALGLHHSPASSGTQTRPGHFFSAPSRVRRHMCGVSPTMRWKERVKCA
jgi:hypothetical protein